MREHALLVAEYLQPTEQLQPVSLRIDQEKLSLAGGYQNAVVRGDQAGVGLEGQFIVIAPDGLQFLLQIETVQPSPDAEDSSAGDDRGMRVGCQVAGRRDWLWADDATVFEAIETGTVVLPRHQEVFAGLNGRRDVEIVLARRDERPEAFARRHLPAAQ